MIYTVTGEFTILILRKYRVKVCVISFGFYLSHFKVHVYLLRINTQRRKTAPFNNNTVISSSNFQKTVLYQGSADRCEGDSNSDIICLLQQSQTIHYCNQSLLAIFPDLNIFVSGITIFDLILRSALVRFSLLRVSFFFNLTGI